MKPECRRYPPFSLSGAIDMRHSGATVRILIVILLGLILTPGWSGEPQLPQYRGIPVVRATRVGLDASDPARTRIGVLAYVGGWHFRSSDPAFGGFSAMTIDGTRFVLVNDGGLIFSFDLDRALRPANPRFGALPGGPGTGWAKFHRDSESVARDPRTGQLWIGFERANAIWRYSAGFGQVERSIAPPPMRRWSKNSGAEAMVRLKSGRFLVFAEGEVVAGGGRAALAFEGDPTQAGRGFEFSYLPPSGFKPTDAAELPGGRLILLNRRASLRDGGFSTKLTVIDLAAIRPGARVRGRVIATLAAPLIHDNFEAVAVTREGRDTIVWLVSDDNGPSWFQRTLLLKFRLAEAPPNRR